MAVLAPETHEDPLRKLYRSVRDSVNREYRYPVQETILGYGKMDRAQREHLIARARETGLGDAQAGALCSDVVVSPNLEELLSEIPAGMERVVGQREDIEAHVLHWNEELSRAALDSDQRANDPDYQRDLDETRYELAAAKAEVKALGTAGKHTRLLLAVGVFVALAGVLVDAILLGAAVEATEQFPTTASYVLGFIAALLLGGFSFLAGWLFGRGRPGGRIASDLVPASMTQTHNNTEHDRARGLRTWRILSWSVVGALVGVIVLLVGLRVSEWLGAQDDAESTTGGLFGTGAVHDDRGNSIWVQGAIILMAVLSLLIFWYEGYQLALLRRRTTAEKACSDAQAELDALKLETQMAGVFKKRVTENSSDLAHLDEDITKAVQSLYPLWMRVIDAYKGSAISWLQGPKVEERLKVQIPVFDGIGNSVRPLEDHVSPTVLAMLSVGQPGGAV